jgi:hypothetical protein
MMFWAHLSVLTVVIIGIGIVYLIVQAIRHGSKKIPMIVVGTGVLLFIGSFAGFFYAAPMYGGINIERSDYNTVMRAVKDGKALSKITNDTTDKQLYDGRKAGKDLRRIVQSVPETYSNHTQRHLAIEDLSTFTENESGDYIDRQQIETLVRLSFVVISKHATPKDEGTKGQLKVFKQMIKDSGY